MTHKKWVSEVKRLLKVADRSPEEALRRLNHLAGRIEAKRRSSAGEWHIAQTLGIIGAILSSNGRNRAAGAAFRRLAKHHQLEFVYHERAYVSALASEAIELISIGQVARAAGTVRRAERKAVTLKGRGKLLDVARKALAASKRAKSRNSRTG